MTYTIADPKSGMTTLTIYTKRAGKDGKGTLRFHDVSDWSLTPDSDRMRFYYISKSTKKKCYVNFSIEKVLGWSWQ